ncbi:ATP-binding cassette domain-containing protein [Seinonella peptonophila]|nr:ATP-binding cassette domain-containing protein [Seinonella peptonophila]
MAVVFAVLQMVVLRQLEGNQENTAFGWMIVVAMTAIFAISPMTTRLSLLFQEMVEKEVFAYTMRKVLNHLPDVEIEDLKGFKKRRSSPERVVEEISTTFGQEMPKVISEMLFFVIFNVALAVACGWEYAVASVMIGGGFTLAFFPFSSRQAKTIGKEVSQLTRKAVGELKELVDNLEDIRANETTLEKINAIQESALGPSQMARRLLWKKWVLSGLPRFAGSGMTILLVLTYAIFVDHLYIAQLFILNNFAVTSCMSIYGAADGCLKVMEKSSAMRELSEFLNLPTRTGGEEKIEDFHGFRIAGLWIEFSTGRVLFQYGLNAIFLCGKTYFISGPSGVGKSQLIKIMRRQIELYPVDDYSDIVTLSDESQVCGQLIVMTRKAGAIVKISKNQSISNMYGCLFKGEVSAHQISLLEWRKRFRFVGQDSDTVWATVSEKLSDTLKHATITEEEKSEIIEEALYVTGLCGKENAYPNELSGGERKRVQIAQQVCYLLFANRARMRIVLFMDEAFSQIDTAQARPMIEYLHYKMKENGGILIIVSHNALQDLKSASSYVLTDDGLDYFETIEKARAYTTYNQVTGHPRIGPPSVARYFKRERRYRGN